MLNLRVSKIKTAMECMVSAYYSRKQKFLILNIVKIVRQCYQSIRFVITIPYGFLRLDILLINFSTQVTMIRRSPTRIELKLDDIQEYESMRREQESRKEQ
jgi:hypothetical protein